MSREMLPKVALQLLERRLHKDVEQDGQGDVLHGVHDDPVGLGLFKSFFLSCKTQTPEKKLLPEQSTRGPAWSAPAGHCTSS